MNVLKPSTRKALTRKRKKVEMDLEGARISKTLFADFDENIFLRYILSFDAAIIIKYEADIRLLLSKSCAKFRNMSYKVDLC